jgi:hypothetical protein
VASLSVWRIHRRVGMSGGLMANAILRETGHSITPEEAARLLLSTGSQLGDRPQFTGALYFHMAGLQEFFERVNNQAEVV